ncbi:zf-TFIIB domain-containing protein [Mycetocola sp. 2940]|uniref:TFIIB-type zinc ribbon-containing protein n=1 Tax=Mycetocola sp. 2940 TaxID=3156452 RepID=UPI00339976E3
MKCPTDSATLVMSERSGIEIDYCPECRGVWLDRGELDKIIERAENEAAKSAAPAAPIVAPVPPQQPQQNYGTPQYGERNYNDNSRSYDNDRRYGTQDGYRKKKKESWLSDLFD